MKETTVGIMEIEGSFCTCALFQWDTEMHRFIVKIMNLGTL